VGRVSTESAAWLAAVHRHGEQRGDDTAYNHHNQHILQPFRHIRPLPESSLVTILHTNPGQKSADIEAISGVATYIEQLGTTASKPTVKQHLAAISQAVRLSDRRLSTVSEAPGQRFFRPPSLKPAMEQGLGPSNRSSCLTEEAIGILLAPAFRGCMP
jgi:hypothetical protein